MLKLACIAVGGALGALARYGLGLWVARRTAESAIPLGTLAVNVLGCLAIGAVMGLVVGRDALAPTARLFVLVGVLGSFTTFSTFGYETFDLLRHGQVGGALAYAGANAGLGLVGVWLGFAAAGGFAWGEG